MTNKRAPIDACREGHINIQTEPRRCYDIATWRGSNMDEQIVKLINNCPQKIKIFLRYNRPKKGEHSRPRSLSLEPGQESWPLPKRLVVGAAGWDELRKRDCFVVRRVPFDPRYIRMLNQSPESIVMNLMVPRPKRRKKRVTLTIEPGKTSRVVDLKAIGPNRLRGLLARRKIAIRPVFKIGPARMPKRSTGWYDGENVHTCWDCGGAIVFRGNPPTPVHIRG